MLIAIDVKAEWFRKPISEIQIMIYEELYGKNWHMNASIDLEQQLRRFKVTTSQFEDESERMRTRILNSSIMTRAEDSLKTKNKGKRISYQERIYLYKLMRKGEKLMAEIALEYSISLGTLYNIKKEFDTQIHELKLEKPITSRNLVESSWIQNLIRNYLASTKIPWSSKDIWTHISTKTGLVIDKRIVRRVMKEKLWMSYKKGLARLVKVDENFQTLIKQWLSIRLWKVIENFKMLINIDETSFSRLTKKSLS